MSKTGLSIPGGSVAQRGDWRKDALSRTGGIAELRKKYAPPQKESHILGLSDATGSMNGIWDTTRKQIKEMICRISEVGKFSLQWCAYRDYTESNNPVEASGWQTAAPPVLRFLDSISCHGGGMNSGEAVDKALEFAVSQTQATRVILIGDEPPRQESNYQRNLWRQCGILKQTSRPVFAFLVEHDSVAESEFRKIARETGGKFVRLKSAEDIIDCVVLTAAQEMGGTAAVQKYIEQYRLPAGGAGKGLALQFLENKK